MQEYDKDTGLLVSNFTVGLVLPRQMVFGPDGHLYVATSTGFDQIQKFDGITGIELQAPFVDGSFIEDPRVLAFDTNNNLYFTNDDQSPAVSLVKVDCTTGAFIADLTAIGEINDPRGIILGPGPDALNGIPVAINDAFSVQENSIDNILDVLANDTDADFDSLAIFSIDTTGTLGTVVNNINNVTYTPPAAFFGVDSFTYIVTDGQDNSDVATVTINVQHVPPTADFEIQRGNFIMGSTQTTFSLTEGVDFTQCTGDCYIQITGTKNTGMGRTSNSGNGNFDNWATYIYDDSGLQTSGGTIDFTRHVTDNRDNRIVWQITEYIAETAGPNEIKVLDTGVCTFGSSALTCSANVPSGATDGNDVVVLIAGVASPDGRRGDMQTMLATTEWDDLNNNAIFTRGESNNDATDLAYAVIEYSGTNWTVERVVHIGTSTDLTTETLSNDVGDVSRAFIAQAQQRNNAGSAYDGLCQSGEEVWISDTNELSFNHPWQSSNWGSNMNEVVWVVSNSETDPEKAMIVEHLQPTDQRNTSGSEEENWQVTINTLTYTEDETALTGLSTHIDGCGNAYPRSSVMGILFESGSNQVDFYQTDAGQEQDYAFSVVQYPRSIQSNP